MRLTYAIADLHGRHDLLVLGLAAIEKHAAGREHTIVTLGDYVDRGPQSAQIIDLLMEKQAKNFICLKGNHELIMLETLRAPLNPEWWLSNGGGMTLISYGHKPKGVYEPSVVKEAHLDWIDKLPFIHWDDHRVFVHAWVNRTVPLAAQNLDKATWTLYPAHDEGGHDKRHVVHGHEQFEDGPIQKKGRTDLDTFAWLTGRLVIGVFDDHIPGGPVEFLEILGPRDARYP